jgi:hypothetical protein
MESIFKTIMPNKKVKIIGIGEKYCEELFDEYKKCKANF